MFCGSYRDKPPSLANQSIWDVNPVIFDPVSDVYRDSNGCPFRQLPQDVAALAPFYPSKIELMFNALPYTNFAARYMWVAWVICIVYLAFCAGGRYYMAARPAFNLKTSLAAWNLALSVFSTIGFIRTAPHLLYYQWTRGFYYSICTPAESAYGHGAVGLWTMLFIYSKTPELIDTLFIVLRKKPLIFLHWYHHVTVLLYCWHSYMTRSSAGLYFVAMNYGVHALMYFYFYLSAVGVRVGWAGVVTILQISQMFVGVAICAAVYYYEYHLNLECDISRDNYIAGLVMYGSYLVLFVLFALERYIWPDSKSMLAPTTHGAVQLPKKIDSDEAANGTTVAAPHSASKRNGLRHRK